MVSDLINTYSTLTGSIVYFPSSIIKSLAGKLSYEAQLIISNSAVIKQAENASKMARELLIEQGKGSKNAGGAMAESEVVTKAHILKLETDLRAAAKGITLYSPTPTFEFCLYTMSSSTNHAWKVMHTWLALTEIS